MNGYGSKMRKYLSVILLLILLAAPASAQQTLVVGIPCQDVKHCEIEEAEVWLSEIYARSGLGVELRYLPTLRDISDADANAVDATLSRTPIATRDYPNLVQVPYPLFHMSIIAAAVKPGVKIQTWADLKRVKVGMMRGSRAPFLMAEEHAVDIHLFNTWKSGIAMLREGRFDAILGSEALIRAAVRREGVKGIHFSRPLAESYTYHYLHKAHKGLVESLARSIQSMLEDGTSRKLLGDWAVMLPELPLKDME